MPMDEQMRKELDRYQETYDKAADDADASSFEHGKQCVYISDYNIFRMEEKDAHGLVVTLKGAEEGKNDDKEGDVFFTFSNDTDRSAQFSKKIFIDFFQALGVVKPKFSRIDEAIDQLKDRVFECQIKLRPAKDGSGKQFMSCHPIRFVEGGELPSSKDAPF